MTDLDLARKLASRRLPADELRDRRQGARALRVDRATPGVSGWGLSAPAIYALPFGAISAISIGPSVNSPTSAFRVSSRRYPPALAIDRALLQDRRDDDRGGQLAHGDSRRLPGARTDSEHRSDDRRDAKEIAPVGESPPLA